MSDSSASPRFSTRAVHGRDEPRRTGDAITTPIAASTTFRFDTLQDAIDLVEGRAEGNDYSRYANPTLRTAERRIAELEGAPDAVLFASGMAALSTTMLALLTHGTHVAYADDCYRPTAQLLHQTLARYGIDATPFRIDDLDSLRAAIQPGRTRVIFCEVPTNPFLRVPDLAGIAAVRKEHRGLQWVVDATLATPLNLRPLTHGADLVVHSATKYLGGHNDLLAGVTLGKPGLLAMIRELRAHLGAICDPHAAYLLLRGLKSFPLRMRQHNETALRVAKALDEHPAVDRVWYPGLTSHPDHERARSLLQGFGGLLSFTHRGTFEDTRRFCDALRVFQIGASLGGAESLLHPPAVFSWWDLSREEREARGVPDSLIRLAIGLEDADDLIEDLRGALAGLPA